MNPIISAALADEHVADLRHAADVARRAVASQPTRFRRSRSPRVAVPFVAIRGWLARGYL